MSGEITTRTSSVRVLMPGDAGAAVEAIKARTRAENAAGRVDEAEARINEVRDGMPDLVEGEVEEKVPPAVAAAVTTQVPPAVASEIALQVEPKVAAAQAARVGAESALEDALEAAETASEASLLNAITVYSLDDLLALTTIPGTDPAQPLRAHLPAAVIQEGAYWRRNAANTDWAYDSELPSGLQSELRAQLQLDAPGEQDPDIALAITDRDRKRVLAYLNTALQWVARGYLLDAPAPTDSRWLSLVNDLQGKQLLSLDRITQALDAVRLQLNELTLTDAETTDDAVQSILRAPSGAVLLGWVRALQRMEQPSTAFRGAIYLPEPNGATDSAFIDFLKGALNEQIIRIEKSTLRPDFIPSQGTAEATAGALFVPATDIPAAQVFQPNAHGATLAAPNLIRFFGQDEDGRARAYLMRKKDMRAAIMESPLPLHYLRVNPAQSLGVSGGSNDAIAQGLPLIMGRTPRPNNVLMFDYDANPEATGTGIIGASGNVLDGSKLKGFLPAEERRLGDEYGAYGGESGYVAMIRWIHARLATLGLPTRNFLIRADGAGGRTLAQLGPGTNAWNNQLKTLAAAKKFAGEYRMPLDASIVFGNHGQSESENTREGYLAAYMAWITNYETASNGVLGGSTPLKFCMDSLASGAGGNPPQAALALVDAARAYPNRVHIGCVYHWFNNNDALVKFGLVDDVHLRPLGYALRGEYWGKWYVDHVVRGLPWTGLIPAGDLELDGLNWRVPIHKQDGLPLTFDTTSVPMATNYGLRVSPISGAPTLSNLMIDNDSSPTVAYFQGTFSSNPSGKTLAYAMFGSGSTLVGRPYAWGNVRNTRTEQSLVIPGLALNDWAAPWSFAIP